MFIVYYLIITPFLLHEEKYLYFLSIYLLLHFFKRKYYFSFSKLMITEMRVSEKINEDRF